jgi:hypothetical protein
MVNCLSPDSADALIVAEEADKRGGNVCRRVPTSGMLLIGPGANSTRKGLVHSSPKTEEGGARALANLEDASTGAKNQRNR